MKKTLLILITGILFSCGQALPDLKYDKITHMSWVQADVHSKSEGSRVLWFQFFDRIDEDPDYSNASDEVNGHPARISQNNSIWMLINDRFEIRLIADNETELYQDTEKLIEFIQAFDFRSMENYTAEEQLTGDALLPFIPDIEGFPEL